MSIPSPKRPNVRNCTHIKVTGQQCGSPALRGEFFCYFHTRVIKGVQQRVDMQLHSMALLEDCESIQLSIMHVVDGLIKGTLDPTRARLIIQALRIAARNAKNVRFDDVHTAIRKATHGPRSPRLRPTIFNRTPRIRPTPEPDKLSPDRSPNRATKLRARRIPGNRNGRSSTQTKRASVRENRRHRTSREAAKEHSPRRQPWDRSRKQSSSGGAKETSPRIRDHDDPKEYERVQQAQAAIAGAWRGNWRDLRTVFEFAGICQPNVGQQNEG